MSTTLGLDLGTNSIGWALTEEGTENNPKGLVACGVRIFQEAVDAKTRTPKNQARRAARSARKIIARRKMRKQALAAILKHVDLLPSDDCSYQAIVANSETLNPYLLRKRGLDEKLEPYELGRILYHLCQRRGFKSNRKALDKSHEDGKIKQSITNLSKQIQDSGCRTLGEFLFNQKQKRNIYTDRSMYEREFELIWNKQCEFYPSILTNALKIKIHRTIFFQRDLKIQKYLVGYCSLEPQRKRAARARLEFQDFRLPFVSMMDETP